MMTIVTRVKLREGCEPRWDAAMRERLEAARNQAGWIAGQVAIPVDALDERVIIGTWQTRADWEAWRADWEAWHADPKFRETRKQLEGLETRPPEEWWHEVVTDLRAAA